MLRKRFYQIPIALLCPPVVTAYTVMEHRQVTVSEIIILEHECPMCQHHDACLTLSTRLAYYPHLIDDKWQYPQVPEIWVLQTRDTDAACIEYLPDLIKIKNYKKPICPVMAEEDDEN